MIHGGLLTRSGQDTAPLLACNETLAVNGLCLSEAQAQMLLRTKRCLLLRAAATCGGATRGKGCHERRIT